MKLFGVLVLLVALAISAVAAYFSIYGLAALFAATAIPVIIMGSSLEVGKLVIAAWLHKSWVAAPFLLKSYLTVALMVLMLITSIGIYGYLSRGHLEQQAPVGTMQAQIDRNSVSISAYNRQIEELRTRLSNASVEDTSNLQQQDEARKQRIQAQIDEQQLLLAPIDRQIEIQRETITRLEGQTATLDAALSAYNDAGAVTRGLEARAAQADERAGINEKIGIASDRIVELENEKLSINSEMSRLRQEMFTAPAAETIPTITRSSGIEEQIDEINTKISELEDTNLDLNIKISETTAKLGPIQYVADLLGMHDAEKAVQILIVLIMFAFDPVAICLLIAAQWTLSQGGGQRKQNLPDNETIVTLPTVEIENPITINKLPTVEKEPVRSVPVVADIEPVVEPVIENEITPGVEASDVDLNDGISVKTKGPRKVEKHIIKPSSSASLNGWLDTTNKKDI